jgi:hypothetical protein
VLAEAMQQGGFILKARLRSLGLICGGHQGSYLQMLVENVNSGE